MQDLKCEGGRRKHLYRELDSLKEGENCRVVLWQGGNLILILRKQTSSLSGSVEAKVVLRSKVVLVTKVLHLFLKLIASLETSTVFEYSGALVIECSV